MANEINISHIYSIVTNKNQMESEAVIVEYLVITKQEDNFCNSAEAFIKFISLDSSIKVDENTITITLEKKGINPKFKVSYLLESDLVSSKNERYFKLTLSSDNKNKLLEFTELTIRLEKIINKLHNEVSINVLWNDIARAYAIEGYALINKVENLLRRLIANFMIINVGYYWAENHIPNEVISRDETKKINNYTDYLYQTYFSDLKTILFQGQRDTNFRNVGDVQRFIQKKISEGKDSIPIEELQGVVAQSLWERFFSQGAKVTKVTLEQDLEELNNLRNEIAHNRHISRGTLGKINTLSEKIIRTLNLALSDLPNKSLTPEEQKFQVNAELERIGESENGEFFNNTVVNSVADWYRKLPFIKEVFVFSYISNKLNLSVVSNGIPTGIEVLYFNVYSFQTIENLLISKYNPAEQKPRIPRSYPQYHLVIAFKSTGTGLSHSNAILLKQLMNDLSPTTTLILGYVDIDNIFRER